MDQARLTSTRKRDHADLICLLDALNGAKNALRRDECGDPVIYGARGRIQAVDSRFYVYVACHSARAWSFAKKALPFAVVTQDGDEEGILRLDRLPSPEEAESIRRHIGLRQTRPPPVVDIQAVKNGVYRRVHALSAAGC
jgi:hypothetical protein